MKLIKILKNQNKLITVSDILKNLDLIIDLAKEDVKMIANSQQIYFSDFDFFYSQSVFIIKEQLKKNI